MWTAPKIVGLINSCLAEWVKVADLGLGNRWKQISFGLIRVGSLRRFLELLPVENQTFAEKNVGETLRSKPL
jgi:hypothetical protein